MNSPDFQQRRQLETLSSDEITALQLRQLNKLVETILPQNQFYADKFSGITFPLQSLDELSQLPFTYKAELSRGDFSANLTYPTQKYVHYHQTSGTQGRPLVVLDTDEDWRWWIDCWQFVLDAAEITDEDRAMMAFSFGPFIGFWSAHDAVIQRGCLVVPGGGMNTLSRLQLLHLSHATCLFCTPTYALHMAEVAEEHNIDLVSMPLQKIIVAGEPGGSVPAIRQRIEQRFNAKVFDHGGASEVGPWGYADQQRRGLHILETQFIAEFIAVETGQAAEDGELSELVLTSLGRAGSPVIRYRTSDLVCPIRDDSEGNRFTLLEGGVLGRSDDMMIIRGMNIFPSSIEQILRSFPEVVEYRITAYKDKEMDQLKIEIEDRLQQPQRVAEELRLHLGLKISVQDAPLGSLPRFEGKGKRFVDER